MQPAVVAGGQQLLQSHGLAITAALGAVLDVQKGLIGLAGTGAAASADDLAWRVDLLADVTAGANDLVVLIDAALAG